MYRLPHFGAHLVVDARPVLCALSTNLDDNSTHFRVLLIGYTPVCFLSHYSNKAPFSIRRTTLRYAQHEMPTHDRIILALKRVLSICQAPLFVKSLRKHYYFALRPRRKTTTIAAVAMTTAATATHTITVVVVLLVLPSVLSSTLSSSGTDAQKALYGFCSAQGFCCTFCC